MPQLTYLEAIRQGIWEEMERDPTVFLIGEDVGTYGGAFRVTAGFLDRLPHRREIPIEDENDIVRQPRLGEAREGAHIGEEDGDLALAAL